jgi:hypothetical protein
MLLRERDRERQREIERERERQREIERERERLQYGKQVEQRKKNSMCIICKRWAYLEREKERNRQRERERERETNTANAKYIRREILEHNKRDTEEKRQVYKIHKT